LLESLKAGLFAVGRRSLIIVLLFLYEIIWSFILYRYVHSVVGPILYRYPGEDIPNWSSLFWIESEIRLLKTDMADAYVLTLLAMLLVRMLLTPLINAGVFQTIHHSTGDQWRVFIDGIRRMWGRFLSLYALQTLAALAPLYWLVPPVARALRNGDLVSLLQPGSLLPWIGYLLYLALARLGFMYIQFAVASGERWGAALLIWLRKLLPSLGLTACILLIALFLQSILAAASLFWAGLVALIIYQATPLLRVALKIWEIASQHDLWLRSSRWTSR
jgi:hypothetical protein